MATTKITDLTAYTDPVNTDVLPIVDVTSDVTKKVSIANVMKNASLGTNSAPGIAFDGDPNTGIYSPGADQVAVTTGGTQRLLIDSSGAVTIAGDLTVNGTTTNINTTNLVIEDKNIILGDVTTPTDVTADGGGITLKGTTDKTLNWVDSTDAWTSSEHINLASGKKYYINGTEVLSSTALGSGVLITSSNITDGTIVNADVNASAAIAGTKISPDFGSQTVQTTGIFSHALGTAGAPTVTFTGDTNTGIYSPGADQVAISTNGTGRLTIDSSGNVAIDTNTLYVDATNNRVGLGTSSPDTLLHVSSATGSASPTPTEVRIATTTSASDWSTTLPWGSLSFYSADATGGARVHASINTIANGTGGGTSSLTFNTANSGVAATERMRIDATGNVGIGTTSPGDKLQIGDYTSSNVIRITSSTSGSGSIFFGDGSTGNDYYRGYVQYSHSDESLQFGTGASERGRFDSSGRFLVGTSTSVGGEIIQSHSTGGDNFGVGRFAASAGSGDIAFYKSRSGTVGANAIVNTQDSLGLLSWKGADGASYIRAATIEAFVDGTPGSNDMPGRLVFSVTQDGSASPTERVRLDNAGNFYVYSNGNDTVVAGNAAGSGTAQSLFTGVHTRTSTTGGGTVAYRIYNNGTTFSVSDERQKKNIESTRDGYLDDIQQLRVVKYNWVDQSDEEPKELGLIAQEVASVFPGLVQLADPADPESTLGIKQSVFSFMLIKALQEAAAKIETLEAKVAALEAS